MKSLVRFAAVVTVAIGISAFASVLEITGSATVEIREFRGDQPTDAADSSESFPQSDPVLPIQVFARLVDLEAEKPSGALAAAQFADPTLIFSPNPEEFALNMGLTSVSEDVSYTGRGVVTEQRKIIFPAVEFGIGARDGDVLDFTGQFFVDGALAILVRDAGRDLSSAFMRIEIIVRKSGGSAPGGTLLNGSLELRGTSGGDVQVIAGGNFPTRDVVLTDLGVLAPDFDFVRVLIIPQMRIQFEYQAALGEEFTLEAEVRLDGRNLVDHAAALAVVGTPTDALAQIFALVDGADASAKLMTAIRSEMRNPSGAPAFPISPAPFFGLCGLFGFEGLLGLGLVAFWPRARRASRGA